MPGVARKLRVEYAGAIYKKKLFIRTDPFTFTFVAEKPPPCA